MKPYDVAIAGGGPAGAVAALVLARAGKRVALVDKTHGLTLKIGESLFPGARTLMGHLGLLSLLEDGPHLKSQGNSFQWGGDELEMNDFIRNPFGHGWHLDRAKFDEDLRQAARRAGAEWIEGHVSEIGKDQKWTLDLGGKFLNGNWVIDATGRNAVLARKLGALLQKDDDRMAAYAWLKTPKTDLDTRTVVESTDEGWWYTSLIPGSLRVVSFHAPADRIGEVSNPLGWKKALAKTQHIQPRAKGKVVSGIHVTPATGSRLDRFAGDQWLAVGDAALSFDPLSSQGIFNAVYSGMKAAEAILTGDLDSYTFRLEQIRAAYLANRDYVYGLEPRWKHS